MPEEAGQGEQQRAGGAGDAGEGHGEGHGWYHGEPHGEGHCEGHVDHGWLGDDEQVREDAGEGHCEGHLDHGWMMMNKSLSWQC